MIEALVPTVVDEPLDFTVIANSPAEMETAQRSLILWAARKIQAMKHEIAEAAEQLALHKKNKWSPTGWLRQIAKLERRAEFYRKIKMALEAGYYIVPPFPIDIFAVRVNRNTPHPRDTTSQWVRAGDHDQPADVLPAGQGRYVDVRPIVSSRKTTEERDGKQVVVRHHYATQYRDVDFPFKLARAEIRQATDRAMDLGVFDQMGALPRRKRNRDPIICGQILVPDQPSYTRFSDEREAVTFFVTWWLDTRMLG